MAAAAFSSAQPGKSSETTADTTAEPASEQVAGQAAEQAAEPRPGSVAEPGPETRWPKGSAAGGREEPVHEGRTVGAGRRDRAGDEASQAERLAFVEGDGRFGRSFLVPHAEAHV